VKERWWEKNPQANLLEAHSFEDIAEILSKNDSRLVLLDFYAPWCNACKSLYPKLNKLCVANPSIVIVKVNWMENKALAKTMGVKVWHSPSTSQCTVHCALQCPLC
jgi:thiol-disulfide isomerase/thioredoxin